MSYCAIVANVAKLRGTIGRQPKFITMILYLSQKQHLNGIDRQISQEEAFAQVAEQAYFTNATERGAQQSPLVL